jgi:hypothetical protein
LRETEIQIMLETKGNSHVQEIMGAIADAGFSVKAAKPV